jgi:predicted dehydrogenase
VAQYRAVIIGCGRRGEGRGGAFGIAESHAYAYETNEKTVLVAAADIDAANLQAFCADHETDGYHDYREMLAKEHPDIVSVCTWPPLHAEMTVDAAEAGAKAIWCEKPMALSLADIDRMIAACEKSRTQLLVNHLRRYAAPFQATREFLKNGRLGALVRMEAFVPDWDLLSWGTHWVDMMRFFADDQPVAWVAAQIDTRHATRKYGHYVEDQSITYMAFENGVRGFLELGERCTDPTAVRVYGSEGVVVIDGRVRARALVHGESNWVTLSGPSNFQEAIRAVLDDLITGLEVEGYRPMLNDRSARATTEVILAAYESAYRRGRIDLPLDVDDFPLERLIASAAAPAH